MTSRFVSKSNERGEWCQGLRFHVTRQELTSVWTLVQELHFFIYQVLTSKVSQYIYYILYIIYYILYTIYTIYTVYILYTIYTIYILYIIYYILYIIYYILYTIYYILYILYIQYILYITFLISSKGISRSRLARIFINLSWYDISSNTPYRIFSR